CRPSAVVGSGCESSHWKNCHATAPSAKRFYTRLQQRDSTLPAGWGVANGIRTSNAFRFKGRSMLKLCGFHLSNYHNKVTIALLERGIPFEEDATCSPSQEKEWLARSPLGKVPIVELDDGRRLAESEVILEYLEDVYPEKPLLPKDPYERAKV